MKKITSLLFLFIIGIISLACIWDNDTIEMERQRFPNTLKIIAGKFLRHSPKFYQWRIKDREAKLQVNPQQWNYYDDLAVAYDKLGNHTKAIEWMLQKEKLHPHQYETYANLGTFYIHNQQYQKGLIYIDKAIAINPNAHFGREVYQKYLVEYVLSKMKNGKVSLPLNTSFRETKNGFYQFLKVKMKQQFVPDSAIKGIQGMIKFGNFNSPILLEALGDLLMMEGFIDVNTNASQLAYLAYQKASRQAKLPKTKELYKKKMPLLYDKIVQNKYEKKGHLILNPLKDLFDIQVEEGKKLFQQIRKDEIRWIKEGKNPEDEFTIKYYMKSPQSVPIKKKVPKSSQESNPGFSFSKLISFVGIGLFILFILIVIYRRST